MKTIFDPRYVRLIDTLRTVRHKAGLTQAQAARRVGMSRVWLGKIERREVRLDVLHFVVLCRVYGAGCARLIRRLEEELQDDGSSSLAIRHGWIWWPLTGHFFAAR